MMGPFQFYARQPSWMAAAIQAVLLSLAATALFVVVLTPCLLMNDFLAMLRRERCLISECLVAAAGDQAVVSYWTPGRSTEAGRHFLGVVDLKSEMPRLLNSVVHHERWIALEALGRERWFALDAAGVAYSLQNGRLTRLWDQSTSPFPQPMPRAVRTLNGGRLLALCDEQLLAVHLEQRRICWELTQPVACIAVDKERGHIWAALADGNIVQIDGESGRIMHTVLRMPETAEQLELSRLGRHLAIMTSRTKRAVVYALKEEGALTEEDGEGHPKVVLSTDANPFGGFIKFSPDERHLITSAATVGDLEIWRLADGAALGQITGPTRGLMGVAFLDERRLLTWSIDGALGRWTLEEGALAALAPPTRRWDRWLRPEATSTALAMRSPTKSGF